MKIAVVQTNPLVGDCEGNADAICAEIDRAREAGATLVVFPELAIPGYPPRDLLERASFVERNLQALARVAHATTGIAAVVGYVERNPAPTGRALCNAAAWLCDGQLAGFQAKTLLPTYDVFDEHRHFAPATSSCVFPYRDWKIGLSICEDGWAAYEDPPGRRLYTNDPMEALMRAGATLIINIAASPFAVGKARIRQRLCQQVAARFRVPLLYVNMVGGNDQLVFDGGSALLNAHGECVWTMPRFTVAQAVIDASALLARRAPVTPPDLPIVGEVYQALRLGLHDYLRKCGFTQVLIGLSGGIDSAVVAAIAAQTLGPKSITGIAMPSPYSSAASLEDAEGLAKNLGIGFRVIPITSVYEEFRYQIGGSRVDTPPDLADENLQARIRGTILMTLSNRSGALLLSTGNKSELAVGYCTLYGDMAGGLALISDVPKMMVYELARWINRDGPVIPGRTCRKPPSAELRPGQTDQETLPEYAVLDQVLKLYIEERRSGEEIVAAGFDAIMVRDILARVDRNEYKRRQAAPGIQISHKAFGIGRRLPLAAKHA